MRIPQYMKLVDKSNAAMIAAIEVYNRPQASYREESFALLAVSAWELLLKARIVQREKRGFRAIYETEPIKNKDGTPSKRRTMSFNRTGNPTTISILRCMGLLMSTADGIDSVLKKHIEMLVEIRDNAAHFVSTNPTLHMVVLELSIATVRNYVALNKLWFTKDISTSINLMMPLAYMYGSSDIENVVITREETRLIEYLQKLAQASVESTSPFEFAVKIDVKMSKSNMPSAAKVAISREAGATPVFLSDDEISDTYPWTYDELTSKLSERYTDFSATPEFHKIKASVENDVTYTWVRYLNPKTKNGSRRKFYSPNILTVFDAHYSRRT